MTEVTYVPEDRMYVFECPHCSHLVQVSKADLNCRVFRHAVYKKNGRPINPHASEQQCKELVSSGKVHGCAGPFRIVDREARLFAVACEYV